MAAYRDDGPQRSMGALLRDLAEGSTTLLRHEIHLARLEFAALFRSVGLGTAFTAVGGVLVLLGGLTFFTGIILLVGDQWIRDHYWIAAMIVTAITGAVAYWLANRGMALLSPRQLAPTQTVATLKEDKEWLKRQLTSGATSR
jgi:drug/metabolite transporter (DMT)-like permease